MWYFIIIFIAVRQYLIEKYYNAQNLLILMSRVILFQSNICLK